jgi:NhaP-type Na+/H+ or K+/H+ antiporter/mannitol/fructose-specific phosphotransferase system IIA component (Ntr-type)
LRREPVVISRLLTVGVLVTWSGVTTTVYLLYDLPFELALIAGSLVIVTGPTVVSPILRRIRIRQRLHHILYWEGVLVDAVGVFVAVLCFEWIASSADLALAKSLGRFAVRVGVGAGAGVGVGIAVLAALRRRWIDRDHLNIFTLAAALLAFAIADSILSEAGILAVIVAGLVIGLYRGPELRRLRRFKLELTEVAIGVLFLLLAARLDLSLFLETPGKLAALLAVVLFALRPLSIVLATMGQRFGWREKAFLAWLGPRGIVAASMSSLFAMRLQALGYEQAYLLETLTYAVIATTVLAQGLSAGALARLLGLQRKRTAPLLLIGEPTLALQLHRQLRQAGAGSIIISTGEAGIDPSEVDIEEITADPRDSTLAQEPRLAEVEAVLVFALDPAINDAICESWSQIVGPSACFRWDDGASEEARGSRIWEDIPTPPELAAALASEDRAIEALTVGSGEDARRFGPAVRPLLAVDEGRVTVLGPLDPPISNSIVALRERTHGLYGLVQDVVIFDSHRSEFEEVVRTLLECAAQVIPDLPVHVHLREIMAREETMPTTVGHGVAIPHIYEPNTKRSLCFVASTTRGLDLTGPDDEPVRLVFLVISPAGAAAVHLRSLAALAQLSRDKELMQVLTQQRTRGRFLSLLRERE